MGNREVDRWDVLDRVSDGVFSVDADFQYTYMNAAAARLVGRAPEQLLGRSMWAEVPGARGSAFETRCRESLAEQRVVEFEEYAQSRRAWYRIRVHPSPDGLTIVYSDVTEEREARQSLAESEVRYRLLAENATDVVFRADAEGRIAWVSPSIREALGWDPEQLLGLTMTGLLHPDDGPTAQAIRDGLVDADVGREPYSSQAVRFRSAVGTYRWMAPRITRTVDADLRPDGAIVGLRLVDDLVRARDRAERDEELLRVSMDAMLDPLVLLGAIRDPGTGRIVDFRYLDLNEATCRYLSVVKEDVIDRPLAELFPWYVGSDLFVLYARAAESDEPTVVDDFKYEDAIIGAVRYYDLRAQRVSGDRLSVTWRDITERHDAERQLAESEERYRLISENTADVVMRTRDNVVLWVSPSLTAALGWTPGQWIGQSLARFGNPADMPDVVAARDAMDSGHAARLRIRLADAEGEWHWVDVHSQAFRTKDGRVDGYVSSFRVVDEEVAAQAELERLARFDALTGVLNRKEILHKLGGIAAGVRRSGRETAVLFCDIDRFKEINDSYGHAAGDEVLRTLTDRIRASIRDDDHLARIGGDELLVVLTAVHSLEDAAMVAQKIRDAAGVPIDLELDRVSTTVSIGVTLMRSGETVDDLVERADAAMYEAKAMGRDRVVAIA